MLPIFLDVIFGQKFASIIGKQTSSVVPKPKYFADQLTLFEPGRADFPHLLLLAPPPPMFYTFRQFLTFYFIAFPDVDTLFICDGPKQGGHAHHFQSSFYPGADNSVDQAPV